MTASRATRAFRGMPTAMRPATRSTVVWAFVALMISLGVSACGDDDDSSGSTGGPIGPGITNPKPLEPFVPSEDDGEAPDLPRALAFAMDNDREFIQAIGSGLEVASEDHDLDFLSANAAGDPAKNIQQLEQFLAQGVGGLVVTPLDPAAQEPLLSRSLEQGVATMAALVAPATTQANVDFYSGGKALGEDAAEYIEAELGGEANVVILNQDSLELVRPRFKAIREALSKVPGAKIVADVEPEETSKDAAFETMNTILQKNPDIDVVLGADSVVLGALAALEAAGKDDPRQYLGGVDGESEARAKISEGGPYKATVLQAGEMVGYAWGKSVADWLDGKTIPQAIEIRAQLLDSPEEVAAYEADAEDPAATYLDYVELFGNISYETREDYLAYAWSP